MASLFFLTKGMPSLKRGMASLILSLVIIISMKKFGLIGYPLLKSFSKPWFNNKFINEGIDAIYEIYPLQSIDEFSELLKNIPEIEGLNVTIPYKKSIIPFLDSLDAEAEAIGAVNVIKFIKSASGNSRLKGYNSDLFGFRESIRPFIEKIRKENNYETKLKALILGTGGASKAVYFGLKQLDVKPLYVSRTSGNDIITYDQLMSEHYSEYRIIVNTTPLGMSPDIKSCPQIDYSLINSKHLLFDAVYNPDKTLFLQKGEEMGATIKNGLEMLFLQAEAAWKIWNDE